MVERPKNNVALDVTDQDYIDFWGTTRTGAFTTGHPDSRGYRAGAFERIVGDDYTPEKLHKYYDSHEFLSVTFGDISKGFFRRMETVSYTDENYERTVMNRWAGSGGTMVDYGCGKGEYGIFAAKAGLDVTLADLDTRGVRFLRYLCEKYIPAIKVNIIEGDGSGLEGVYDYVFCNEVLEHVINPKAVLRNICAHIKDGGEIYLSTFFNDLGGLDPSHLKQNNVFQDDRLWHEEVAKCGLRPIGYDPRGVLKVWKKG